MGLKPPSNKFTYKVRNKKGTLEPWSGVFNGFGESQEWYIKHGINFEKQGYKLVLSPHKRNRTKYPNSIPA